MAWRTGGRIVEMVAEDLKPSDIMTRAAFLNAIRVNTLIGGSTNAPIHLAAIADTLGVDLPLSDWERHGHGLPLVVNMQPAGEFLGEDFHHAGGVPAVVSLLAERGLIEDPPTVTGRTLAEDWAGKEVALPEVIWPFDAPLARRAGFKVLTGNLFDSAIMKTSVISRDFRTRYLANPDDPEAFEGVAMVFDGPEDYHARIDDPAHGLTERSILVMRGTGPLGYPGGAEVVNMRLPAYLLRDGITELPCIGDGRQSGTSGSPSILSASPEAAAGGGLALLQTGDRLRIDLSRGRVDMIVPDRELAARRERLMAAGGYAAPDSQTPWQAIYRDTLRQMGDGAGVDGITVLGLATEVLKLTGEERRDLIDWAAADIAGRVPFSVAIAGNSVAEQAALAAHATAAGADWLILQPPIAGNYGVSEYLEFFARVGETLSLPWAVQNAPAYLGRGLTGDDIMALRARSLGLTHLKAESPAIVIAGLMTATGGDLVVLNGRGGLEMPDNLRAGCDGFVLAPDIFDHAVRIHRLWQAGEETEAEGAYARALPAITFVMQSIEHLICYGKRLYGQRAGHTIHDRGPALRPGAAGLDVVSRLARRLGPFGAQSAARRTSG